MVKSARLLILGSSGVLSARGGAPSDSSRSGISGTPTCVLSVDGVTQANAFAGRALNATQGARKGAQRYVLWPKGMAYTTWRMRRNQTKEEAKRCASYMTRWPTGVGRRAGAPTERGPTLSDRAWPANVSSTCCQRQKENKRRRGERFVFVRGVPEATWPRS